MPTITPPPPPQSTPAPLVPAPVLTVTNPPVELARLTIGALLEASILNQTGKETYLLQTPIGQLSVQTALTLPKDGNLVLQILSLSPQAQLQISTLNGRPASTALRAVPHTGQDRGPDNLLQAGAGPAGKNLAAGKAGALPPLAVGAVVKASLMRSLPSLATGKSPLLSPGRPLQRASPSPVANAPLRGGVTGPVQSTPAVGAPSQITPRGAAPAASGAQPPSSTPALPAGTRLGFRITDLKLPTAAASNVTTPPASGRSANLTAGVRLTGTVTGTTTSGHAVVQTEAGVFSLNAQSSVPRGTVITLVVTTPPKLVVPVSAPSSHPGTDTLNMFQERRWPPLEEAVRALHQASPAASQQLVHAILPRPDVQLTTGLLFFLTALRGGDIRSWFGEANMRLVEKTRPNLATRLANDFSTLAKMADEPINADWRVALIPINTGAEIEQVRLLLRHHDEDEQNGGSGDHGTRFVLDVDLSRLGRIQLDGLVRDNGKKLDLIIRSADTLNNENRNEIRRIFAEASELTGVQGGVTFQASPPNYIDIPDPLDDHKVGLIV